MPLTQDSKKEHNWYKLTTVLLSGAVVLIMFITGIVYRWADQRAKRLERIDGKITDLQNRKGQLAEVPKVIVKLLSLSNSGLPSSAFRDLKEVPAVVQITHAGGKTAKGITVEVSSVAELLRFIPEPSMEGFSHTISQEKDRLKIEIAQLRSGASVQGTLMCDSVSSMSFEARIDEGEILDPSKNDKKPAGPKLASFDEIDAIAPQIMTSPEQIDEAIAGLRELMTRERERSLSDFTPGPLVFVPFMCLVCIAPLGVTLLRDYYRGRAGNEVGQRIGLSKEEHLITVGMPVEEVESLLGLPNEVRVEGWTGGKRETWSYIPRASVFFGWQPDVFITFKSGQVSKVEYKEYGRRKYSQSQDERPGV